MKGSIRVRLAALAGATLVGLGGAGAAAAAVDEYVPFVTDFPSAKTAEPYRPFATDFGIARRPAGGGFVLAAEREPNGRAWADFALGGVFGFGAAGIVGAAALLVRRQLVAHGA